MLNSLRFWLLNTFKTDDLSNLYANIRQTIPVREIQPIRVRCITEAPDWNAQLRNFG